VKRWLLIATGFVSIAILSIGGSIILAFLTVWAIDKGNDDNPALGLFWFMLALAYMALMVPAALSWFAELVQRHGQTPKPSWLRLARRLPFALIASVGIMYSGWMLAFRRPDLQPLWPFNVIAAAVGTLTAVYLAVRIRPGSGDARTA
jgi:hypothetical protein